MHHSHTPWLRHFSRCVSLSVLFLHTTHAQIETPKEIHLTADLDGDTRPDVLVIDRASGSFRAAYQTALDAWTWSNPRSTGLADITGATTGRWFSIARDSFAVTSPLANRSHIVAAQTPAIQPTITPVFGQGLGPSALASPDIAGAGNTAHADIWIASRENGGITPFQMDTLRHNGTTFTPIAATTTQGRAEAVRTVPLKNGGTAFVAYLGRTPASNDRLTILNYSVTPAVEVLHRFLPEGSQWTSGALANAPFHHILTWTPGESQFRSHPVTEGPPNVFALGTALTFDVTPAIGHLAIVPSDLGPRLVITAADGSSAEVFNFTGNTAPTFLQQLTSAPGQSINALLPLAGGGFQLLTGPQGTGTTTGMIHHRPNAGLFTPAQSTTLPDFRPAALRANTFAFSGEPFVTPSATLLARYNTPEWTSTPVLAGLNLSVSRETFGGTTPGLGSKAATAIGTVPLGTTFALTNQFGTAFSVHSFDAGGGSIGADVGISPPPGNQTQAFRPEFSPTPALATTRFRINGGPWQSWPLPPDADLVIHTTTTIHYYAIHPVTLQPSPIRTASYTFDVPPHAIDSDADGVPDFVEIQLGLNPLGGLDHDGDGYSDLEEILANTIPNNKDSKPAPNSPRPDQGSAFQLRAAPRPIDGTTANRSTMFLQSLMKTNALDGTLLASRPAQGVGVPGIIGPGLRVDNLVADDRLGLVSVTTEPNFSIATPDPDPSRGREITAFFPIPTTTPPTIAYTPAGGTPAAESTAWIAAAKAASTALERPIVSGNFTEIDTLAALLLEGKIEEILLARAPHGLAPGLTPGKLTLFAGRTGDAARFAPTADDLAALRLRDSLALPGYNIATLFQQIATAVKTTPALADARTVATAIYRASSAHANTSPPGTYLPPFDVLRAFARGGSLPAPYAADAAIPAPTLASAHASMTALLAGLGTRPVSSFTLLVGPNSFTGNCATLNDAVTTAPVTLFAAPGIRYQSTDNFDLLPGTKVLVTGYTDLTENCPGQPVEVITLTVLSFPAIPYNDANANLLPDDWEWTFLLGFGGSPWADDDNDGISNLQEYLDGTDPLCATDKSGTPLLFAPPQVQIVKTANGQGIILWWQFPQQYINQVQWKLFTSQNLADWEPKPAPVLNSQPGWLSIELPQAILNDTKQFYRLGLSLK